MASSERKQARRPVVKGENLVGYLGWINYVSGGQERLTDSRGNGSAWIPIEFVKGTLELFKRALIVLFVILLFIFQGAQIFKLHLKNFGAHLVRWPYAEVGRNVCKRVWRIGEAVQSRPPCSGEAGKTLIGIIQGYEYKTADAVLQVEKAFENPSVLGLGVVSSPSGNISSGFLSIL